jgi:signal transduction histidine kinase
MKWLRLWRAEQDPELLRSYMSFGNLAAGLVFVFGAVPAIAYWPAGQRLFEFNLPPILVVGGSSLVVHAIVAYRIFRKGVDDVALAGVVAALTHFLGLVECLLVFSGPRVEIYMGVLIVITLLTDGYMLRYSYRHPAGALAAIIPTLGVLPFCPTTDKAVVLVFAVLTGIVGALVVGDSVGRRDRIRLENLRLREALAAERLARKELDIGQLSRLAVDMLGNLHDVGNALMVARLNAESLEHDLRKNDGGLPALKDTATEVVRSIARLQATLASSRELAHRDAAELARASVAQKASERAGTAGSTDTLNSTGTTSSSDTTNSTDAANLSDGAHSTDAANLSDRANSTDALMSAAAAHEAYVPLVPPLEEIIAATTQCFPGISIALHVQRPDRKIRVLSSNGAETIRRIFENLLVNACEGDGTRAARAVHVSVSAGAEDSRVMVTVADDGPGFSAPFSSCGVIGFVSTKLNGSGLGLFTTERLVRDCGGAMTRANQSRGGALVSVYLSYRKDRA